MNTWVAITIILSFTMSFSIGSNDAANGLGTSYGANATTVWKMLILGAIAEFMGAMFLSSNVAEKLVYSTIPPIKEQKVDDDLITRMMFAVCLATSTIVLTSSTLKMPISGTHTAVGSLVGAGMVGVGLSELAVSWILFKVTSWFYAPFVAMMLSCFLVTMVTRHTLDTLRFSYEFRIRALHLVSAIFLTSISAVILIILRKKYATIMDYLPYILIFTMVFGVFLSRLTMMLILASKSCSKVATSKYILAVLAPWTCHTVKVLTTGIDLEEGVA